MCGSQGYGETHDTEFNFAIKEDPDSDEEEEVKVEEGPDMINLTAQCICPTKIFQEGQEDIVVCLLRKGEEVPCEIIFEKVDSPAEDIRLKALLKLTNGKVFDIIQKAQK